MTDNIKFTLTKPIEDKEGNKIETLTLREPTLGDHCAAEKFATEGEYSAALMAGMAGVDIPTIQKMTLRDYKALGKLMDEKWGNDPATDGST